MTQVPSSVVEQAIETAPVGCALVAPDLTVRLWSRAMATMTGIPAERILGQRLSDHFPRFADPAVADRLGPVAALGLPTVFSARIGPSPLGGPASGTRRLDLAVTRVSRDPTVLALWLTDVTHPLQRGERYREALAQAEQEASLRRQREAELERARDEAEAAVRAKAVFLAHMSHELRTPLAGVIGMTDVLASLPLDRPARECVDTIRTCADSLLSVINDVLDFSRSEADALVLEDAPVDLESLVDDSIAVVSGRAEAKGLGLLVRLERDLPTTIAGDPARLRQVLVNLLGNAVKFTATGTVELTVAVTEGRLSLRVQDSGIGMSPDTVERLFRPFSQAEAGTTRRFGGSGLGLAICHRLVALMQGTIRVDSQLGRGSCFTVEVPVRNPSPCRPPPMIPGRVQVIDGDDHRAALLIERLEAWGLAVDRSGRVEDPPAIALVAWTPGDPAALVPWRERWSSATRLVAVVPLGTRGEIPAADAILTRPVRCRALRDVLGGIARAVSARSFRIAGEPLVLVVDDEPVNRRLALILLQRLGCRVAQAVDGPTGIATAREQRPDLVLMDWQMPGMDGLEAAASLRRSWPVGERRPTLVAVTANAMPGDRIRCLEAGLDDYLAKPYRVEDLVSLLLRWLPGTT